MIEPLDVTYDYKSLALVKVASKVNELIDAHNRLEELYYNHFHEASELQFPTREPMNTI